MKRLQQTLSPRVNLKVGIPVHRINIQSFSLLGFSLQMQEKKVYLR